MHTFLLLRGHEGSGKSFFAAQTAEQFRQRFDYADIVLIDNDAALTDRQGRYQFDFEAFAAAHRANMRHQEEAFAYAAANPQKAVLIINANPNQKAKTCHAHLAAARAHGLTVAVYRLHNFFANQHHVPEDDVLRSYARLNANPVDGEIHLPPVRPMSAAQRRRLAELLGDSLG